jgi:hypothetical protein
MTERTDIIARLSAAGVIDGYQWAYTSAVARTLADYSEEAGHDAAWLGLTCHTLFCDRLDRVFSCGRYALDPDADETSGLDLVRAELFEQEIETIPSIPAGLVTRADLNQSPGWRFDDLRLLVASAPWGKIDSLPWSQKGWTKQVVASRPAPEPGPSLLDMLSEEDRGDVAAKVEEELDLTTFVVGHSLDPVRGRRQLVLGRSRLNFGGGDAWHWYEDLYSVPPSGGAGKPVASPPPAPDDVPDAPVKLRKKGTGEKKADGQS